jgi:hypothetical protein
MFLQLSRVGLLESETAPGQPRFRRRDHCALDATMALHAATFASASSFTCTLWNCVTNESGPEISW